MRVELRSSTTQARRWFVEALGAFLLLTTLVWLGATDSWFDRPLDEWVHEEIPEDRRQALFDGTISAWGSQTVRIAVLAMATGICLGLRAWRNAVTAPLAFGAATSLVVGIKLLVARPRPFDPGSANSFPSGHAALVVVAFGLAAYVVWDAWRQRRPAAERVLAAERATHVLAILVILLVGIARVLGGVHHPTDVLGGWALGTALLFGTVWIHQRTPYWWARARHRSSPEST